MRAVSTALSFLLATSLACGQKPKENPKDPLLTKPPTSRPIDSKPTNSQPTPPTPTTATTAPTAPKNTLLSALPDLDSYLTKGTEITDPQTFAYTFEAGKSAKYQVAIRWNLKGLNIPLMADFSGGFTADLLWSMKEVDAQGTATVEMTYGRIQAEFDALMLGGKKSFDSKASTTTPEPLLAPFGKMDGKTFSMKISKEGKISELVGQDKILEEALSDPTFPAALKDQIKAAIGEKGLSQVLGQGFLAFPTTPMKKNDEFKVTSSALTIPALGQISLQEGVTLAGIRDADGKKLGLFALSLFAVIEPQNGAASAQLPELRLVGEAVPTIGDGFFVFDMTRGLPALVALPVPLDLKISFLKPDGTPSTPQPINVIGDVTLTAQLIE